DEAPAEYHDEVVAEVLAHVGGDTPAPMPSLCGKCPAAHWTLRGERLRLQIDDPIERAQEANPWRLVVFCRVLHQELTAFIPDYLAQELKARGDAVYRCNAYAAEVETWRRNQS
ncbi:MAG TPA: hypothetical protein PLY97_10630, partial [Acidocella sp.]|nr:hypothetical protein [Acidocella sp.]